MLHFALEDAAAGIVFSGPFPSLHPSLLVSVSSKHPSQPRSRAQGSGPGRREFALSFRDGHENCHITTGRHVGGSSICREDEPTSERQKTWVRSQEKIASSASGSSLSGRSRRPSPRCALFLLLFFFPFPGRERAGRAGSSQSGVRPSSSTERGGTRTYKTEGSLVR